MSISYYRAILNSTDSYRTFDDQIESMPQSSSAVVIVDLFTILIMALDPFIPQLFPCIPERPVRQTPLSNIKVHLQVKRSTAFSKPLLLKSSDQSGIYTI